MKTFEYAGFKNKKTVCGHIEATSAEKARHALRSQGITLLKVRVRSNRFHWRRSSMKASQRALFTRQLATLLAASVPLMDALQCVSKQSDDARVTRLADRLKQSVIEGKSLSEATHVHEKELGPLFSAMVKAGETSGQLVEVLLALADHMEQQAAMRQSIMQALLYPMIMTTVALMVVMFLLWRVVPMMLSSLQEAHVVLPWPTVCLLALSDFFRQSAWLLLSLVLACLLLFRTRFKMLLGSFVMRTLMRVPGVSSLIVLANTTRFIRALSVLQRASVPLMNSVQTASLLVRSPAMLAAIKQVLVQVSSGRSLADALQDARFFSAMCVQMVRCGEQTGELSNALEQVAEWQSEQLAQKLKRWMTLFEPALMLVMGGVVLFIVLSVMLPIFSMDQAQGL